MLDLVAILTTVHAYLHAQLTEPDRDPERGSITIDHVLWAVAVIAIAGIVIRAVTNYVTEQAGRIR